MYNLNSTSQLKEQEIYAFSQRKEALENEKGSLTELAATIEEEVKQYETQYNER